MENFVFGLIGKQDLNLGVLSNSAGYGTFSATLPDGSVATLNKVSPVPFIDVKASPYSAVGDGVADDTSAINTALADASTGGGAVFLPIGTYKITNLLSVPAGVRFFGAGRLSKLQSAIPTGLSELVRLTGDYASIDNMWLNGEGQGDGSFVTGSRGIWIGLANNSSTRSDHCSVTNCIISEFNGNGISGAYYYANISGNTIRNNTDANIFLPPLCGFCFIGGNYIIGSRFAGIDSNSQGHRIIGNDIHGNGSASNALPSIDRIARVGILLANISNTDPCVMNTVIGNNIYDNSTCGIFAFGSTGSVTAAFGHVIKGNVVTGHTNVDPALATNVPAGISIVGCSDTIVDGNICRLNRDNIVVSGSGGTTSALVTVSNNKSISATRHGYFFTHSPRVDLAGDNPPTYVQVIGNTDNTPASDSFKFLGVTAPLSGYTIAKNKSLGVTSGYNYLNAAPGAMSDFDFEDINNGEGSGIGYLGKQSGFGTPALTPNSATPSVKNGRYFLSQNTLATTWTDFTGGIVGQIIFIQIADANTTLDFTSSSLKGYYGADVALASGDFIKATYNGASWYCDVMHMTSVQHSVTQATSKSTAVTLNWLTGNIVMNNAALAADAEVAFDFNNSTMGAADVMLIGVIGGPNASGYTVRASNNGAGLVQVGLRNVTTGSLSDAVVLGFQIFKQ